MKLHIHLTVLSVHVSLWTGGKLYLCNVNFVILRYILKIHNPIIKYGAHHSHIKTNEGKTAPFNSAGKYQAQRNFSTVQKFPWAMEVMKYINFINILLEEGWGGRGGRHMTLLAVTDHLYLILMLLKYKITNNVYHQADNWLPKLTHSTKLTFLTQTILTPTPYIIPTLSGQVRNFLKLGILTAKI